MFMMTEQDALWNSMCEVFPSARQEDLFKTDLKLEVETLERSSIESALMATDGNRTKAANMLNLGRTCLIAKMKKYELV